MISQSMAESDTGEEGDTEGILYSRRALRRLPFESVQSHAAADGVTYSATGSWYANGPHAFFCIQARHEGRRVRAERSRDFELSLKVFGVASGMDRPAILLIDDNAVQAATRQAILKRVGHHVIAVLSPLRALEQFRQQSFPAQIGLVITDHLMPEMNGAQFTRELRALAPGMPVMVISGL